MKKLIIITLLTLSAQSFASYTVSNLLAYTIAEAIYSTALPVATSGATTAMTEAQKQEALQVQNDVQEFNQSGVMSISLMNKIEIAKQIDASLSLNESLDALVAASNIVLNQ
jgi:hypothetical protein